MAADDIAPPPQTTDPDAVRRMGPLGAGGAPRKGAPIAAPAAPNRRRQLFSVLGVVVLVGAVVYGLYWFLVGSHHVSTDNAYVGADVAQVTPLIAGAVTEVSVADTQAVHAGDILARIDPADAKVAAERAMADYGRAIRRVNQDFAGNDALQAQIAARDADLERAKAQLASAQSDVDRTRIDLQRRQALAVSGAVSGEELTTARNAYQTAAANLEAVKAGGALAVANRKAAQSQLAAQQALTQGAGVTGNPEVAVAKAALDSANLDMSRTTIRAPIDGVVTRRQVQVGQRVAVGSQLMLVVPVNQLYVDANFKEGQLRHMRIGQPATLSADLYGGGVKFHGQVVGLSGGTGSAFAIIPAQNATGNWIKVVQRLPVRIRLDPRELSRHPLRVGLSMKVDVDIDDPGRGDERAQGGGPVARP